MRLYSGKVPVIAGEIVKTLTADKDIEVDNVQEVETDLESVLKEYLRLEREITEKAKDRLEATRGDRNELGRIKRTLAEQKGFGLGDEGISWILDQLLQMLMRSPNVAEVYSDDAIMRRKMRVVLQKHMSVDDELDKEVRAKIKNLQEGTATWEVEYAKVLEQAKRKRGLS
jgi:uncharacterized protein